MNIETFEQEIDQTILDRGYDYYLEDLATLINIKGLEYRFRVFGSEHYKVVVTLWGEGDIGYSSCNCPYDYGSVCKHEVAVYYELRDLMSDDSSGNYNIRNAQDLTTVLNDLSKEELIEIIGNIADEDLSVKNRLLLQYSKRTTGQEVEVFKSLIRSIVHKYSGRIGFIEYREAGAFVGELGDCLLQVEECEDVLLAMDLAFLLLDEAIEAFQYTDDSNGDVGSLVEDTLGTIERKVEVAIESAISQRQALFEKILQQCDNSSFEDWDEFRESLLRICMYFADEVACREKLVQKIESLMVEESTEYIQRYHNESMLCLLFEILEEYGTKEEVGRFIKDHLQYTTFRERLIQQHFADEKYERIIQLAMDGEEKDRESSGLVSKWKNHRYAAYKALSRYEEQRTLAQALFMDGDFSYYRELKNLAEDQVQYYAQLKQELRQHSSWQKKRLFKHLIEEENDAAEMLVLLKEDPRLIESYADDLVEYYPEEIQLTYHSYILHKASVASNRSAYQGVCESIRQYITLVGKQHQQLLVDELRNLYKRKPAFMDELSKIKKTMPV